MGLASAISDPSSLLSMFLGQETLIDDIKVDVVNAGAVESSYDVTQHPVETGLVITDARIEKPLTLTLDAILTDDEIELSVSSAMSMLDGVQTWKDKRDRLFELQAKAKVITVKTTFKTFSNLLIASVRVNWDKSTSTACWFSINFQQVKIVQSAISAIGMDQLPEEISSKATDASDKAGKKGAGAASKGSQSAEEASEKESSLALQGLQKLGVF
jgi:hypothetical protein